MIIENTKTLMAEEFNETCYLKHVNIDSQSVTSDYTKLVDAKSDQKQINDNNGFGSSSGANSNCSEYFQEVSEDYNIQVVDNFCCTLKSQSTRASAIDQQEYDNVTVSQTSVSVIYFFIRRVI